VVFGRPIFGVHNRTRGLVADFITFLFQRCLSLPAPCTRTLASQVRDACLTNSVRKVVLIGHSTGGLHISIALDQLHDSLPVEVLHKLEIYTFGSAASHLSNPCLRIDNQQNNGGGTGNLNYTRPDGSIASPVKATLASLGHRVEDHERVIPHVEHYALASDLFARCGVLHNTRNVLDNRFCGRVFILDDTSNDSNGSIQARIQAHGGGFLMNEHYLDLLFPVDGIENRNALDQVVEVDIETAEKREFTAQGFALPQKALYASRTYSHNDSISSQTRAGSPEVSPRGRTAFYNGERRSSWDTAAAMGMGGVGKARSGARECEGKTVKQLSRLWRYANGGRPVGEGIPLINGVGNGMEGRTGSMSGNGMGMMQ
jgi:hypothetical protein